MYSVSVLVVSLAFLSIGEPDRIITETFLGLKNSSLAIQMVFAATFLCLGCSKM